ncbi:matrin 3-like 1.1 isoform X2 [Salarias fasciatus]|uniref:matrin 3-like 1.1 isoform X2 n=1 Tax=Salarias fasciatus TaxID=181472 RepID=UPI0011765C93|nr:trichohyalin-like isoform X2 [Salarias fasciatus]
MSHNYPYRFPPSQTDTRPHRGTSDPKDSRQPSGSAYIPLQDSYCPSYSSPTSSSSSRSSVVPQDNVLNLLSSCGLEPEDLARLAELPEDALTVESLPHILQQMKGKKGVVKPCPSPSAAASSSSTASFHSSSTSQPAVDWEQLRSQPVQYPLISSTRLPSEKGQEYWGPPRTSSSVRTDPPSSSLSSSGYMVDTDIRSGPPNYGKTDPVPSFSAGAQRPGSSHISDSGPAVLQAPAHYPPHLLPQPINKHGRHRQNTGDSSSRISQPSFSSSSSSSSSSSTTTIPSMKQAQDFHGTLPLLFPYACSLCDITVLSEKVWIQHINSTQHADGQLKLLQEFPKWDCRIPTGNRDDDQSQSQKKKRNPAPAAHTAKQSRAAAQSNNASQKKMPDKGKVVCVKFPPQSVDEAYLRKLIEPFGKIVKILMFPSLAFVELGSDDQAKDLVKFHVNYPPTVNGSQIEFSISSTFNFLQSAQVVSFTPVPAGADGRSDLISIVKRFGVPLYTLFLPSKAFVEMTTLSEAQKLVDYYSSNVLRISDASIKVSFSVEYRSLARVSSAKKYEEPPPPRPTKRARSRTRSRSRDRRTRTRSKSRERRTRSRSTDRFNREKRTRSRSRSREEPQRYKQNRTRSRSRDRFNRERRTRSRSRDRFNRERRTRSRTRSRSKSRSKDKTISSSKTETKSGSKAASVQRKKTDEPAPVGESKPEPADSVLKEEEEEEEEDDEGMSVDDSDIEGMEVIGGEVEDEDAEEEEEEEEEEKEEAEEPNSPAEKNETKKKEGEEPDAQEETEAEEEKVEPQEASESQLEEEDEEKEEEEAFPVDLENCITLDELGEDDCAESGEEAPAGQESPPASSRVVYISDLPLRFYSDADFLGVVRGFGTAVRYLLIRRRREGFVEMSTPSEASKAARELSSRPTFLNKSRLKVLVSHKYKRLTNGWTVEPEENSERRSSRRTRRRKTSKTPDRESRREPAGRKSPEQEARNALEEEPASREKTDLKETPEETQTQSPQEETQRRPESPQEETHPRTESPQEETERRTESPQEETHPRTKSPQEETQRSTKSPQQETQRRTESPQETRTESPQEETQRRPESPQEETHPRTKSPQEETQRSTKSPQQETQRRTESPQETRTESPQEETQQRTESPQEETRQRTEILQEETKIPEEEVPQINGTPEAEMKGGGGLGSQSGKEESESQTELTSAENPAEAEKKDDCKENEEKTLDQELPDGLKDAELKSAQAEGEEDSNAAQKPSKPIGTEFVRPVVGYFCNLCQLIYADEDEAKQEHCRTPEHYRRYQEKTGKDPWAS